MKIKKWAIALALLTATQLSVNATHLVGGEMTYRSLGNNMIELNLKIYRDCLNGIPLFDDPALVYLYSSNLDSLRVYQIPFSYSDTLPVTISPPCSLGPIDTSGYCIETGHYIDTIDISLADNGSFLSYQNCCLPLFVTNVEGATPTSPGGVSGFSLTLRLADISLAQTNSSPVYNNLPSDLLCRSWSVDFDHSATDADSDSLSYELITPFDGQQSGINPIPLHPPYPLIRYIPGYSLNDVMGFNTRLRLNQITGKLTSYDVTVIGSYVYGARTHEYRNGKYIGYMERIFFMTSVNGDSINPNPNHFPVGVNERNAASSLKMYPNPVTEMLRVEMETPSAEILFTLTDLNGRVVQQNRYINRQHIQLDVSALKKGMYIAQVKTEHGTFYEKLLKN